MLHLVNALMSLIHHVKLFKFYIVLHGMQLNICITKKHLALKKKTQKTFNVILSLGYWKGYLVNYFLK